MELWLINDLYKLMPNARLTYTLKQAEKVIKQDSIAIDITRDSGKQIDKLTFSDLAAGNYQLLVKVVDLQGNLLGENIAKFEVTKS